MASHRDITEKLSAFVSGKALAGIVDMTNDPSFTTTIITSLLISLPSIITRDYVEDVAIAIKKRFAEVEPIVKIIWRMALLRRTVEQDVVTFFSELTVCLNELTQKQLPGNNRTNWEIIKPDLVRLLSSDSAFYLSAKAQDLLNEQSLSLCSASIISDMRPIFDDKAEILEAILPFHTLTLLCHDDKEEHRKIFVALTASDLRTLKKLIDRAERKERLIRDRFVNDGYTMVRYREDIE